MDKKREIAEKRIVNKGSLKNVSFVELHNNAYIENVYPCVAYERRLSM